MSVKPANSRFLNRFKPGAPVHIHLFIAALIWSIVGIFLLGNGLLFTSMGDKTWFSLLGVGIGTCKSIWVLDKVAQKNINRIQKFENRTCIGSVYSYKSWVLIIVMILMGRYLRSSGLPAEYVGILYAAVGWGLLLSSRLIWMARIRMRA